MEYGQPVRFGVFLTPDAAQADHPVALAALADGLGFDLIGVQDHPYQRRFLDTWTLLTAIAMRTKTVKVFPDVANLPLRPPAIVAKAAATLDLLSGGRLELGLGAGGAWGAASERPGSTASTTSWRACTRARPPPIRSGSGSARTSLGCCPWSGGPPTDGCRRLDTSSRRTCSRETGASTRALPPPVVIRAPSGAS